MTHIRQLGSITQKSWP